MPVFITTPGQVAGQTYCEGGGDVSRLPFLTDHSQVFYAALPEDMASSVFPPPTLTLICLGLASAFLASLIFSTPVVVVHAHLARVHGAGQGERAGEALYCRSTLVSKLAD